ncbi:hypothetical protein N7513_007268 [Penicillium frequentans]|nr:hypothetical protein N7513_007268 [Penicillium glabrum]
MDLLTALDVIRNVPDESLRIHFEATISALKDLGSRLQCNLIPSPLEVNTPESESFTFGGQDLLTDQNLPNSYSSLSPVSISDAIGPDCVGSDTLLHPGLQQNPVPSTSGYELVDYATDINTFEQPYNCPANFLNAGLDSSSLLEPPLDMHVAATFFEQIFAIPHHDSAPTQNPAPAPAPANDSTHEEDSDPAEDSDDTKHAKSLVALIKNKATDLLALKESMQKERILAPPSDEDIRLDDIRRVEGDRSDIIFKLRRVFALRSIAIEYCYSEIESNGIVAAQTKYALLFKKALSGSTKRDGKQKRELFRTKALNCGLKVLVFEQIWATTLQAKGFHANHDAISLLMGLTIGRFHRLGYGDMLKAVSMLWDIQVPLISGKKAPTQPLHLYLHGLSEWFHDLQDLYDANLLVKCAPNMTPVKRRRLDLSSLAAADLRPAKRQRLDFSSHDDQTDMIRSLNGSNGMGIPDIINSS